MKKAGKVLLIAGIVFLSLIFMYACQKDNGQVPVYQGMTVRKSINSVPQNAGIDYADYPLNAPHYDNGKNEHGNGKGDPHIGHRKELPNEIEDIISIDVVTDDEVKYYVQPNEVFIIEVHIDNPNGYEIQSFTLNGQKYANYMFKEGSTMELLLLETTAPSTSGYVGYSIDAIKYIDGTEIKDVDMSSGNKTIKAGIAYTAAPTAEVSNEKISTSSFSFDVTVTDENALIGNNELMVYLSDGEKQIAEKAIQVGENSVVFDNLVMSKMYEYGIVTSFDMVDGRNIHSEWLYTKEITTLGAYTIENVNIGKEEISFDVNKVGEVGTIDSISLYDANTNEIVQSGSAETRSFNGLLSNHTYNLYVDFSYTINGETITDWAAYKAIKTLAKKVPVVSLTDFIATKTEITCVLDYTDTDDIGIIDEVYIANGDDAVQTTDERENLIFNSLQSGVKYTVVVKYSYDLNDGYGIHNDVYTVDYPTLVDSIAVEEIILLNNNVVKSGEELNMRIYFINPSEIEMTAIYINGQQVSVVGGDRVESAIIKFVPSQIGLIDFSVDKVDYLLDNIPVSQRVDSEIAVQYPIYGDLGVTFTPVTSLYYDVSGDGTYLEFDNSYKYNVYKINGTEDFITLGDGQYYYFGGYIDEYGNNYSGKGNRIDMIEYGYDDYGHTTQTFTYDANEIVSIGDDNYKKISTVDELLAITNGYYYLTNDIDARNVTITKQIDFTGVLVGNGYKIRGLHNVIDTANTDYYNIFNRGTFYDVNFTELYISVNGTSEKQVTVLPLGGARLVNCSVKGDINGNEYVAVGNIYGVDNTTSYNYNVTINNVMETRKFTATNISEKNENVEITESGTVFFTFPNGKKYLFGTFDTEITTLNVSDDITVIGGGAFKNCNLLTEINIPENTLCADDVFGVCPLKKANLPVNVLNKLPNETRTTIEEINITGKGGVGAYAFQNCSSLTSVTIGNGITSIGDRAFYGCSGLTSIIIGNGVTSIGEWAFYNCSGLTSINIPDGVTSIGSFAFYSCSGLASIIIGNGVTSIGEWAFYNCSGLTSINIPDGVTSIGSSAFYSCSGLASIYYTGDIASWCGISGLWNIMSSSRTLYIGGNKLEGELVIPDNVTSIGEWAFYNCSGLTSINIPDSVTSIGSYAFCNCSGLTSINIPDSVTSIGEYAFGGCSGLTSVNIPDSVTSIGSYLFSGCSGLTSINIPDSVTSIGEYAFYNCGSLTRVNISDGVTSIGSYAFYNCRSLTSITIPDSVTSIGSYAFKGCSILTSVTIGNGVTSIGEYAFYNCSILTSITIPDSVTSIGSDAFKGCDNLNKVYYGGTQQNKENIAIASGNESLTNATWYYYAE